jgi:hypothetical protein
MREAVLIVSPMAVYASPWAEPMLPDIKGPLFTPTAILKPSPRPLSLNRCSEALVNPRRSVKSTAPSISTPPRRRPSSVRASTWSTTASGTKPENDVLRPGDGAAHLETGPVERFAGRPQPVAGGLVAESPGEARGKRVARMQPERPGRLVLSGQVGVEEGRVVGRD